MNVPDYLTYYFRDGQKPFEVLTDLDPARAEEILEHDTPWRGDGTYLGHRVDHERYLRERFISRVFPGTTSASPTPTVSTKFRSMISAGSASNGIPDRPSLR